MMFYKVLETCRGPMAFGWQGNSVLKVALPFKTRLGLEKHLSKEWHHFHKSTGTNDGGWLLRLEDAFIDYFEGIKTDFSWVSLNPPKTEFKASVYKALRSVGWGQTISYQELGLKAGRQRCGRSVGSFMARNPTPLLIPCHRVLATSRIGGFSDEGGAEMKRWMLRHEGAIVLQT